MTEEDQLAAHVAASNAAIHFALATLVDELERANILDPASFKARLTRVADQTEQAPSPKWPLRDQAIVSQLRAMLALMATPTDTSWQPVVIPGGREEGPSDAEPQA